jgi:hypothetical protein
VWLEINGPPIQRFVRPLIDLAAAPPVRATHSWRPLDLLTNAFIHPAPLADWVMPRIETFRSMEWLATLRDLVRREKAALEQRSGRLGDLDLRVLFVADVPSSGICHFFFRRPVVLRLLHGEALVEGLGIVRAGDELRPEGRVSWRAVDAADQCVETDGADGPPALWMIVLQNGENDFEIQPV